MRSRTDQTGRGGSIYARLGATPWIVAAVIAAMAILVATIGVGLVEPTSESVVMAPWRW